VPLIPGIAILLTGGALVAFEFASAMKATAPSDAPQLPDDRRPTTESPRQDPSRGRNGALSIAAG
jgi:hypothetical protein